MDIYIHDIRVHILNSSSLKHQEINNMLRLRAALRIFFIRVSLLIEFT